MQNRTSHFPLTVHALIEAGTGRGPLSAERIKRDFYQPDLPAILRAVIRGFAGKFGGRAVNRIKPLENVNPLGGSKCRFMRIFL